MSKLVNYYGFDINIIMKHKHHIIPRHMGGTDDPSNLIELTIEEHADAHKKLYEEFGRWQDYVAWQGLAKLDKNFDAARESMLAVNASRKGKTWEEIYGAERAKELKQKSQNVAKERDGKTWDGKSYEVVYPNGSTKIIKGLRQWCFDNKLNPNTVANACLRGTKTSGGYRICKV